MSAQDGEPTPRPSRSRAAWLLSPVASLGRLTVDAAQYEELRAEALALKQRLVRADVPEVEWTRDGKRQWVGHIGGEFAAVVSKMGDGTFDGLIPGYEPAGASGATLEEVQVALEELIADG